jgi:DNA-binding transcriptional LysR family regulator
MNSVESILDVAVAGAGIVTLSNFVVADAIRAGKLKLILREYIARESIISIVYLPSRHLSSRMQAFVSFLSDLVRADGPWNRLLSSSSSTET